MMLKITRVITDLSFLKFLVFIIYWVTDLTSRYSIEILLYDENGQIFFFAVPDKYSDECFAWFNFVFAVYDRGSRNSID